MLSFVSNVKFSCIDHSAVIAFLHANKQIWDRIGANLGLSVWPPSSDDDIPTFWDVFFRQIWPIFTANIRQLSFPGCAHLDTFLRLISPTRLTDLDQLNAIDSDRFFAGVFTDADADWPNPTSVGKSLVKWLHTPSKYGQPKRLFFDDTKRTSEWLNIFKETFCRATASSAAVSYKIRFGVCAPPTMPPIVVPFELVNERTNEKLTLTNECSLGSIHCCWLLKRCKIFGETEAAAVHHQQQKKDENWADNNLNNVFFDVRGLWYKRNWPFVTTGSGSSKSCGSNQ